LIVGSILLISAAILSKGHTRNSTNNSLFTFFKNHSISIITGVVITSTAITYYNYTVFKSGLSNCINSYYGYDNKNYSYDIPFMSLFSNDDSQTIGVNFNLRSPSNTTQQQYHSTYWYVKVKKVGSGWAVDDAFIELLAYMCRTAIVSGGMDVDDLSKVLSKRFSRADINSVIMFNYSFLEYFSKGKDMELAKRMFNIRFPNYKL